MKKNYFIIGCPRSGKTTLTNMIMKYDNSFNCLPVDSLIFATKKNFSEVPIHNMTTMAELSRLVFPFIETYLHHYSFSYPEKKYIVEGAQINPDDLMQSPLSADSNIICLGFPNATAQEIFQNIRSEDAKLSYSYSKNLPDEKLQKRISFYIKYSKTLQEKCNQYGIPFYETNINRQKILGDLLAQIIRDIENSEVYQH